MDRKSFEADLARDGFDNAGIKKLPPGCHNDPHAHDFEVRALVLEGRITVTCADETQECGPGDIVRMAAGREHAEDVGADGLKFIVGRKSG